MRPYFRYKIERVQTSYEKNERELDAWQRGYVEFNDAREKRTFLDRVLEAPYIHWDEFLRKHLQKDVPTFSIGSGALINELALIEDGFTLICSDIQIPKHYHQARKLFGPFSFRETDIIKDRVPVKCGAIICLSVMYLFDKQASEQLFIHVSEALKEGEMLILDVGGSEDKLASSFWDNYFLKFEKFVLATLKSISTGRKYKLVQDFHGYKYQDREILGLARKHGFALVKVERFDFVTEWARSMFLRYLIDRSLLIRKFFSLIGRANPYIRVFAFKKLRDDPYA